NLLDRYPVLYYLISLQINNKIKIIKDVIERFYGDSNILESKLKIKSSYLQDIIFSKGDSHNNGNKVLFLVTKNDQKVVYKPHSLKSDISFENIINWVNNKCMLKIQLKNIKSINCKLYGWQQYIEYKEAIDTNNIKSYYYRLGALLALFYMINCTDIHSENIISCKDNPYIIDLETLITKVNKTNNDTLLDTFFQDIENSTLNSMLLPVNFKNSTFDFDLSGITGESGYKSRKIIIYDLINIGTDEIRLVPRYFISEANKNRLKINNKKTDVLRYYNDIEDGFSDCYDIICKYKYELIGKINNSSIFKCRYRQVLRPTQVYGTFLEASYHPNYLKNFKDRYNLFSKMFCKINKNDNYLYKRIKYEIKDLMKGDIPYFSIEFDKNNLILGRKKVIENYYKTTLKDDIIDRISKLKKENKYKQLSYIRSSLSTTINNNRNIAISNQSSSIKRIFNCCTDDFLKVAINIGEYYYTNAIWNTSKTKCTWLSSTNSYSCIKLIPTNYSIYESGGLVLFLAFLAKESGNSKYENLSKSALKGIEEIYHSEMEKTVSLSAFYGMGSLIYLYYILGILWNDNNVFDKYKLYINKLANYNKCNINDIDYIGGISGLIVLLIKIYLNNSDQKIFRIIYQYGTILYEKVKNKNKQLISGYAHGYAGISVALIMLGYVMKNNNYTYLGIGLITKENTYFDKSQCNWADLRGDKHNFNAIYWCYGAPGIGLARASVKHYIDNKINVNNDIVYAIHKTMKDGFNCKMNHSICHGLFGNLDSLIEISNLLKNDDIKVYTLKKCKELLQYIKENGIRYGIEGLLESSSLMLGLPGVGYVLLRLLNQEYPSILTLDVINEKSIKKYD
ncbi:type 2 lanthipeptide synthetase LanM, partial [Clostridium tyrobutyricum]